MKSINKVNIILALCLIFTCTMLLSINLNFKNTINDENTINRKFLHLSATSEKIFIDNNWSDANTAGICIGEGNSTHPYIIKDLIIDAGNIGSCIWIENTNDYFKIENCTLYNSQLFTTYGGISLLNVTNGLITNNSLYNNLDGIYLNSSTNNNIIGNNIYNCDTGLELLYSNANNIYLNSLTGNNIDIFYLYSNNNYYSEQKFIYTYNGNNYTNYLGNHWSNYIGSDDSGDGVGESPFTVTPFEPGPNKSVLRDEYPLLEPHTNYNILGIAEDFLGAIPGYHILLNMGIISLTIVLILNKIRASLKLNL